MVKHIKTIRDKEVSARMRALSQEEDPNEERVQTDSTTCKPKRGLIDRVPKILTIDVATTSTVAAVNVLAEAREHGVLRIEVTQS